MGIITRPEFRKAMAKKWPLWLVLEFILGLVFVSIGGADEGPYTNTIMHPDSETSFRWGAVLMFHQGVYERMHPAGNIRKISER